MSKRNTQKSLESRFDAMQHKQSGRGTAKDKLEDLRPALSYRTADEMRSWYESNGFIQNIIDGPAEDATREWISIKTNRDDDDPETGLKGLAISRMIENRMTELDVRSKIKDLIRYTRLYKEGGFMYYGILANEAQTDLSAPMPSEVNSIDFINVFGPDRVSIITSQASPLSRKYHKKVYSIGGRDVHASRLSHLVHSYIPENGYGISIIDTVLDGIKAQDTALWSVTSYIFEMVIKVFKSPLVSHDNPEGLARTLAEMRAVLSTQGAVAIAEDESLSRIESGSNGGFKELFDFIFENLAGLARMPKSRLMGQAQGVITAGQFDLLNYYDTIAKFQELEIKPILEKIVALIISEKTGKIYNVLNGRIDELDWEITFNPLWKIAPMEKAEIGLKNAQRDQIRIASSVLAPSEVRSREFSELEKFPAWEKASLHMRPSVRNTKTE